MQLFQSIASGNWRTTVYFTPKLLSRLYNHVKVNIVRDVLEICVMVFLMVGGRQPVAWQSSCWRMGKVTCNMIKEKWSFSNQAGTSTMRTACKEIVIANSLYCGTNLSSCDGYSNGAENAWHLVTTVAVKM